MLCVGPDQVNLRVDRNLKKAQHPAGFKPTALGHVAYAQQMCSHNDALTPVILKYILSFYHFLKLQSTYWTNFSKI